MLDWFGRTFLRKLTLSVCLLVLSTAAMVGLVASRVARTHLADELASALTGKAELLLPQLDRAALRQENAAVLDRWADGFGGKTGARVTLTTLAGKVVGDSEVPAADLALIEDHSGRPEIRAALAAGRGRSVRHSSTVGADFLYVAVPIRDQGKPAGTLRLAMPLSSVHAKVSRLRLAIAIASLLCLLAALPLAVYVSRSIHNPVGRLADAADRIAHGDFTARAEVRSHDEFGRLAEVLNALAKRVGATVGQLSAEKAPLEATLNNIAEAVALVDRQGRIQELNPVMRRLFALDSDDPRGRPFRDVIGHDRLWGLLETALQSQQQQQDETILHVPDERLFEASANPIIRDGELTGAVLALYDITRLRRLESVRKEFVANVSHELRTPLAHIKGSAETLRRGGIEDRENRMDFVETIENHADRMTRIVDDLLDLAAIESDRRAICPERLSLAEAVQDAIESLGHPAKKKGVSLICAVTSSIKVTADRAALHQILLNLLENAIKYNHDGGRVEISARTAENEIAVSVQDTGIGIPEQELPRLFERFYRVDKARSRALGGTGLGLSIVKHLVETLGGRIWAESSDHGSTFRFTLPAGLPS
ncbi:MAG: ATP-binding protein [Elusimicrobiota bacterium]